MEWRCQRERRGHRCDELGLKACQRRSHVQMLRSAHQKALIGHFLTSMLVDQSREHRSLSGALGMMRQAACMQEPP